MFTPKKWETENKIGNALYRINQSPYKEFCEIDKFYQFLVHLFKENPEAISEIQEVFLEYAEYVEERTRFNDLKVALNQNQGMKKELKYKVLEAQL